MSLPIVAIVGRPNVGKSSLLNALVGRRISIVDPIPGVTRDRVSAICELPVEDGDESRWVELVDTGGMGIEDSDQLTEHVESQIDFAVAAAAVVLFVVDAREGVLTLDRHVARRLRRQDRPVLLVANKIDQARQVSETGELHSLGFGEPIPISATHVTGLGTLATKIDETLAGQPRTAPREPAMKLAVAGKRNAGKSTLVNALVGGERVIVSERPGTTRDSVDVTAELDGRSFTLIDTAGVRKARAVDGGIEYYSQHRSLRSIRRADVVLMMIDASLKVSQVDKHLAGQIAEHFKPVVFVVNKWDLARDAASPESYAEYLEKTFPELAFAPLSLTVAREGVNVRQTLELAEELYRQSTERVGTGELNRWIEEILAHRGPSHKSGTRRPKIYYATQIATAPPTIVCVVNDPKSFDASWQRFLVNRLRDYVPYAEVPIRLIFRPRGRREKIPQQ
jgi:GTP-binding protein